MKIRVSKALKSILSSKQLKLLKAYLANYTIRDIVRKLKIKHEDVLLEFIFLGKKLALYELTKTKIVPDLSRVHKRYMDGFRDYEKQLKGVLNYDKIEKKRKRPNRKATKKRRSKRTNASKSNSKSNR